MTTIEWTEESWNPLRAKNKATGAVGHFCVHASEGCRNCYAERQQPRYRNPVRFAAQDEDKVEIFLDLKVLKRPLGMARGREIFPCSMTDLFGAFHNDGWIDIVMAVAALTPRHTYQCLTKQALRMRQYFDTPFRHRSIAAYIEPLATASGIKNWQGVFMDLDLGDPKVWPLPNWNQGVSVEDQSNADRRIPMLIGAKVARRWISAEPLLDGIDVRPWLERDMRMGTNRSPSLDWVVVGGESGHNARPFDIAWAEDLIGQCRDNAVRIFVKQIGASALARVDGSLVSYPTKHPKGGDPAEWPEALRVRERLERIT